MEQALIALEHTDEDDYNKNVWMSGAHIDLARLLREVDPTVAKYHLEKAKEIIDADERLTLRKKE